MIIEGVITTENADGSMHVAPIGPHVDPELTQWELKPFQTSTTFANLRFHQRGVFHVTDDALMMAAAVLGLGLSDDPEIAATFQASYRPESGWILSRGCRSFALRVESWDVSLPRANAVCRLVSQNELRSFWGWNRAAHSILELSILASRRHMIETSLIQAEVARHQTIIDKTAGPREFVAWELLKQQLSQ
jgi:uncharacterized protein